MKLPVPDWFDVLASDVVGFWLVLQQTPLAVIVAPPSAVISPPEEAEVAVILVKAEIVAVGAVFMASFLQFNKIGNSSPARNTLQINNLIFIGLVNLINN